MKLYVDFCIPQIPIGNRLKPSASRPPLPDHRLKAEGVPAAPHDIAAEALQTGDLQGFGFKLDHAGPPAATGRKFTVGRSDVHFPHENRYLEVFQTAGKRGLRKPQ
jgi:hypothetical protein